MWRNTLEITPVSASRGKDRSSSGIHEGKDRTSENRINSDNRQTARIVVPVDSFNVKARGNVLKAHERLRKRSFVGTSVALTVMCPRKHMPGLGPLAALRNSGCRNGGLRCAAETTVNRSRETVRKVEQQRIIELETANGGNDPERVP
jgi:hypothetical protein